MKLRKEALCLFIALLLLLPLCAWAGSECDNGNHPLDMIEFHYPTCEADGYYILECINCDYRITEISDPAWGHDWESVSVTEPDCEHPGLERMQCANCGEIRESVIPAPGHTWRADRVLQEPTCTSDGLRRERCETCGATRNARIPASAHDWQTIRVRTEATCAAPGQAVIRCRACGQEDTRTLQALPHAYSQWVILTPATETTPGTRTAVCTACGQEITEHYEYAPGTVAIHTTAGKVNLRTGPGTNNRRVTQVAKRGTYLGQLFESAPDRDGTVWFRVRYEGEFCWVMSDFARATPDADALGQLRLPDAIGTELSDCFLMSIAPIANALGLQPASADGYSAAWSSEALHLSGADYIELITFTDAGHSLYGICVGDRAASAQEALRGANLVPAEHTGYQYAYRVPCLPNALHVSGDACCATLYVIIDLDGNVAELRLESDAAPGNGR